MLAMGRNEQWVGNHCEQQEGRGRQGYVVPHKSAELSFKSAGRVQEIFESEGDLVAAGKPLVQLETRNLEQIILQTEAGQVLAHLARPPTKSLPGNDAGRLVIPRRARPFPPALQA
jgi:hypothetical protein